MIAAGILAAAGTAHAAPMIQIVDEDWGWFTDVDAQFQQGPPRTGVGMDDVMLLTNPINVSYDFTVDAADLGPNVNAISAGLDLSTNYNQNTGFSIQSRTRTNIDMKNPFSFDNPTFFEDFSEARSQVAGRIELTLTEDATVRMRVDGFSNIDGNDDIAHRVVVFGGPSLAQFEIGTEPDSTVPLPFDQTIDLLAGDYIFEISNGKSVRNDNLPEGFSHEAELNFSFEIVPAPGATALFGLAGLTATRRRR